MSGGCGCNLGTLEILACVGAGAYKGFMDAQGTHVDPAVLYYTVGGTYVVNGIAGFAGPAIERNNRTTGEVFRSAWFGIPERDPVKEGLRELVVGAVLFPLSAMVGYGLGYAAQKVFT